MSQIFADISKIESNPYRFIEEYPLKPEKINMFKGTIIADNRNQLWHGLPARKHPTKIGMFQLTSGHHRLEAAKQLGIKKIKLEVEDRSDEEMVQLMTYENATQTSGDSSSSVETTLYSVKAASWVLTYAVLRHEAWSNVGPWCQGVLDASQYTKTRNNLIAGNPLGWRPILRFLKISSPGIKEALATLNATGELSTMIKEISTKIKIELETEKLQQESDLKLKLQKEKETKLQEEARKNLEDKREEQIKNLSNLIITEASSNPKLDPQVIPYFPTVFALKKFRDEVTNPKYEQYYPLNSQLDLIKKISQDFEADEQKEKEKNTKSKYIPKLAKEHLSPNYVEKKLNDHRIEYRRKNYISETQNTPAEDTSFTLKSVMQLLSNSRQALALAQTSITIVNKDKHEMSITAILAIHEIATEAYQTWLAVTNKLQSEVVTSPSIRVVK